MYEGMLAETVIVSGHNGDEIEAYYGRPLGSGPYPGVVVIHHAPGWDEWTREVVRKLAQHGYAAIAPHLYHRGGPGTPDDVAAKVRAAGGVPDDQVMGDVGGSMKYLRAQAYSNGKIGVMGFCSGGRHTYLAAAHFGDQIDAAVDCWGGGVVLDDPATQLTPQRPVEPITLTASIRAPLLGIFGNEDANPSPEHVSKTEAALEKEAKNYDFHRYDGAGHGFFAVDRPGYRSEQATDAWKKVFEFYEQNLGARAIAAAGAR